MYGRTSCGHVVRKLNEYCRKRKKIKCYSFSYSLYSIWAAYPKLNRWHIRVTLGFPTLFKLPIHTLVSSESSSSASWWPQINRHRDWSTNYFVLSPMCLERLAHTEIETNLLASSDSYYFNANINLQCIKMKCNWWRTEAVTILL